MAIDGIGGEIEHILVVVAQVGSGIEAVSYTHLDVYKRQVNDGLDIGVLLFYTFLECGFIVLQLDFIEWRHAIGCLKLSKERICLLYTSRCV